MRNRINLLALLVVVAGGAVIARPTPASATLAPGTTLEEQFGSCCSATINGTRVAYCCSLHGCQITQGRCLPWS
ncbi:MAG TPA: hypothetical protein VFJ82_24425 [Longimicrobium sp.]|nr:hypothetical protein [Longimicrobium sp.]